MALSLDPCIQPSQDPILEKFLLSVSEKNPSFSRFGANLFNLSQPTPIMQLGQIHR